MKPKIRLPYVGEYPISFKFKEDPKWYTDIAGYPHNGVDFAIPVGKAIVACDDGVVVWADQAADGRGRSVHILHSWGLSVYYHLSVIRAKFNQSINKGELLGFSGATGWATGPHLHWGLKVKGYEVPNMRGWCNPLKYVEEEIQEPTAPVIQPRYHFVRIGESLWKISERYYGSGIYWRKIYDANRKRIKNPTLIYPFQRLLIP